METEQHESDWPGDLDGPEWIEGKEYLDDDDAHWKDLVVVSISHLRVHYRDLGRLCEQLPSQAACNGVRTMCFNIGLCLADLEHWLHELNVITTEAANASDI